MKTMLKVTVIINDKVREIIYNEDEIEDAWDAYHYYANCDNVSLVTISDEETGEILQVGGGY